MNSTVITLSQVCASLGGVEVLHELSTKFGQGQWSAVVGPNGAGKSTLLKAVAGLIPVKGRVCLDEQDLYRMPAHLRARQIAWLGQNESGGDDLLARDIVMLGRLPHQGWLATPADSDHAAVEKAMRLTQCWDWRARPLGSLSGGERQRVLLARLLAVEAAVLLMDEPLASLDPPHQSDWMQIVRQLVQRGTTVISVLHEVSVALQADQMLILDQGHIRHHGLCRDPLTHRALEQVFGQRIRVVDAQGMHVALSVPAPSPLGQERS